MAKRRTESLADAAYLIKLISAVQRGPRVKRSVASLGASKVLRGEKVVQQSAWLPVGARSEVEVAIRHVA